MWSLTLSEEHKFLVSENKVLEKTFDPRVIVKKLILCKKEFHNSYCSTAKSFNEENCSGLDMLIKWRRGKHILIKADT
jgi:hypothetical protein